MKLSPMTDKRHRKSFTPAYSFTELAKMVGKSVAELRGIFARDASAPKPRMVRESGSYYDLPAFMAWWNKRGAA